jgi:hypothetical protein
MKKFLPLFIVTFAALEMDFYEFVENKVEDEMEKQTILYVPKKDLQRRLMLYDIKHSLENATDDELIELFSR